MKDWLNIPSSENAFVLTTDGTLAITIATKEGAGTGHPAVLEVDVIPSIFTGGSATFTDGVTSSSFTTDGANASFYVNTGLTPFNNTTLAAAFLGKNSNGPQMRFQEEGSVEFVDIGTDGNDNFVIENSFDQAMLTLTPTGNLGLGITTPGSKLTVNGVIETLTGGIKFPNGSVQTQAAPGTGTASQFTNYGPCSFINEDTNNRVVSSIFDGVWTTGGSLLVPLHLPSGARVLSIRAYVNDTAPGVNIRVQSLTKTSTGSNSIGSAFDFVVNAGTSGYFNQTGTQNYDYIISADSADYLWIRPDGGNWPGNKTIAVQNITVEWIMP